MISRVHMATLCLFMIGIFFYADRPESRDMALIMGMQLALLFTVIKTPKFPSKAVIPNLFKDSGISVSLSKKAEEKVVEALKLVSSLDPISYFNFMRAVNEVRYFGDQTVLEDSFRRYKEEVGIKTDEDKEH